MVSVVCSGRVWSQNEEFNNLVSSYAPLTFIVIIVHARVHHSFTHTRDLQESTGSSVAVCDLISLI